MLEKFQDRFSRFDTIPAVTDTQPAGHVAVASTPYAYLRRAVKIVTLMCSLS